MRIICKKCKNLIAYDDSDGKFFIKNIAWIDEHGNGKTRCKRCHQENDIPIEKKTRTKFQKIVEFKNQ